MAKQSPPLFPVPSPGADAEALAQWARDLVSVLENYSTDIQDNFETRVPAGGTTGQQLTKKSDNDFDIEWS